MGNYVIAGVGNYVIENPSDLGNFMIADIRKPDAILLSFVRFVGPVGWCRFARARPGGVTS